MTSIKTPHSLAALVAILCIFICACNSSPTFEQVGFVARGVSPTDQNPTLKRGEQVQVTGGIFNLADQGGQLNVELTYAVEGPSQLNPPAGVTGQFAKRTSRTGLNVEDIWSIPDDAKDGQYTLKLLLQDKVAGKSYTHDVPFQVKGDFTPPGR
jgi:hypothetical protein